jgi:hypothetical protein
MLLQIHNSFIHVKTPQIIQMEIIKSDNVKYQHWNFILKQTKQGVNYLEKKKPSKRQPRDAFHSNWKHDI